MTWRKDFLRLIRDEYQTRRQKNPRYSIRAFARDIGVSPGPTSELIKGTKEWKFSEPWALRILNKLSLTLDSKKKLLAKMGASMPAAENSRVVEAPLLTDWAKIPVLISLGLPPPHNQMDSIAQRLKISEARIQNIISELKEMGWIEINSRGEINQLPLTLHFNENDSSEALKQFHSASLELAQRALREMPSANYNFQTVTMVGSIKDIEDLRKEMTALIQKATALMNQGDENDEVFRMNLNLFPLHFEKSSED